MRKILSFILVAIIAISCTNQYQSNLEKMDTALKLHLDTKFSEGNGSLSFHSLNLLGYDTVSTLTMDSLNRAILAEKLKNLNAYAESLTLNTKKDAQAYSDQKELIATKVKEIAREDSLLTVKMQNTKEPGKLYRARASMILIMKVLGQPQGIPDTVTTYFTPELEIITPNDYKQFNIAEVKK